MKACEGMRISDERRYSFGKVVVFSWKGVIALGYKIPHRHAAHELLVVFVMLFTFCFQLQFPSLESPIRLPRQFPVRRTQLRVEDVELALLQLIEPHLS